MFICIIRAAGGMARSKWSPEILKVNKSNKYNYLVVICLPYLINILLK